MRGRVLAAVAMAGAIVIWVGSAMALALAWRVTSALEHAGAIAEIGTHPQATVVLDRTGREAFSFFIEQRIDVPLSAVSPEMAHALLAVEDRRFYSHHGLDVRRIGAAAYRNWRAGRILEGGSTLTQQLGRLEQLTPARTFTRKVREAAIAVQLERRYSKDEILQAYLNAVYFGDGYHGVEAASRGYFGKPASDLAPHEAALLAALVRSPTGYSPTTAAARSRARRNLVLRLMRDQGFITPAQYTQESAAPLLPPVAVVGAAGNPMTCGRYFEEAVRRELVSRFGGQAVLSGGLRVHTGYDPAMECEAERAVAARIAQITKQRPAARDLEASLVALDPASGEVRALIGGRDYTRTSYIRAIQAHRQPGSAFKPVIYAAALERGMAPATVLHNLDQPIQTEQGPWLPAGDHEQNEYSLRAALKISSNRAAAQLLQQVGLGTTTYYAQRLGIRSELPNVPSLALGTGGVTLLELTGAYAVFANQGLAVAPHLIDRVDDQHGTTVWTDDAAPRRAVSPATAFLMNSMLSDVITSGTATTARSAGFKLPAAGKTGTTDNYTDAWFIGYTPHLVAGVWFGMDKPAPIMSRGFAAVVAVPAWADFMKQATAHDAPDWFVPPPDVEKIAVCPLSGLLATDACRHGVLSTSYPEDGLETLPGQIVGTGGHVAAASVTHRVIASHGVYDDYFAIGTVPTESCPLHAQPTIEGTATVTDGPVSSASTMYERVGFATSAGPGSHLEKVIGTDGRAVWVVKR